MNINPALQAVITPTEFYTTLAHEFQHMIHWEQKTHQKGLDRRYLAERSHVGNRAHLPLRAQLFPHLHL